MSADPTAPASRGAMELLPCPFCGGAAEEIVDAAIVNCQACGAMVNEESPARSVERWNRRSGMPTTPPSAFYLMDMLDAEMASALATARDSTSLARLRTLLSRIREKIIAGSGMPPAPLDSGQQEARDLLTMWAKGDEARGADPDRVMPRHPDGIDARIRLLRAALSVSGVERAEERALRCAVTQAAEWFREYEATHMAKAAGVGPKDGQPEDSFHRSDREAHERRAARNRERAEFMERALAPVASEAPSEPERVTTEAPAVQMEEAVAALDLLYRYAGTDGAVRGADVRKVHEAYDILRAALAIVREAPPLEGQPK